RDGMMESGVKHRGLGQFGTKDLSHGENALDVVGIVEGGQIDAILNPLQHLVSDEDRFGKEFPAVNHTMPSGMDVGRTLDFRDSRSIGYDPTNQVLQGPRNIGERSCKSLPRSIACLHRDDGFSADSLSLAAAQALVAVLLNPVEIGRNQLKFESRTPRVEH